jgi:hypothetical protein
MTDAQQLIQERANAANAAVRDAALRASGEFLVGHRMRKWIVERVLAPIGHFLLYPGLFCCFAAL